MGVNSHGRREVERTKQPPGSLAPLSQQPAGPFFEQADPSRAAQGESVPVTQVTVPPQPSETPQCRVDCAGKERPASACSRRCSGFRRLRKFAAERKSRRNSGEPSAFAAQRTPSAARARWLTTERTLLETVTV